MVYTEECLWVSLDAMTKCMAAYISCFTGEELGELIQSASMLAFEYGRLKLYQKEQALLDECLQNQYLLDDQLQTKFNAFKRELQEESEKFNDLLERAFDSDFRAALIGSVGIAREVGVNEDEILHSAEEIDAFFL